MSDLPRQIRIGSRVPYQDEHEFADRPAGNPRSVSDRSYRWGTGGGNAPISQTPFRAINSPFHGDSDQIAAMKREDPRIRTKRGSETPNALVSRNGDGCDPEEGGPCQPRALRHGQRRSERRGDGVGESGGRKKMRAI